MQQQSKKRLLFQKTRVCVNEKKEIQRRNWIDLIKQRAVRVSAEADMDWSNTVAH